MTTEATDMVPDVLRAIQKAIAEIKEGQVATRLEISALGQQISALGQQVEGLLKFYREAK